MEKEDEQTNSIYEARTEEILSHKHGKSMTMRTARFLKPCATEIDEAQKIPNTPLLSEFFSQGLQQWPPYSKVQFKGWRCYQKNWKEWVDKLAVKYGAIWKQTGICDAIMSSIYEVRCNRNLVLGLSEFWCSETNSFVFPWGESTITLEDVMILGSLPVLGEPITCPLSKNSLKIEDELNRKRLEMNRNKSKKATHQGWLNLFMEKHDVEEGESDELEHVAFLSLWLSRYVFPSIVVEPHVFKIAIHLSKGTPMALASSVLASIYRNLRSLEKQAIESSDTIVVSGSFQLVQLWAFEHFPLLLLGPKSPNCLQPGEPRTARWHKLWSKITLPHVRSVVKLAENFQWRPYAANVKNWRHLSYYRETEQVVYNCLSLDEELQSFVQCLYCCELVGVDSDDKEKYMPNRVAMQFGYDQDLPCDSFGFGFDFVGINLGFFVPKREFEPGVSVRYFDWWKESMLAREDVVSSLVQAKKEKADLGSFESKSLNEDWVLAEVPENSESEGDPGTPKFDSGIMDEDLIDEDILEFPKVVSKGAAMTSHVYQAMQAEEEKEDVCDTDTFVASKRFSNSYSELIGSSDEDDDQLPLSAMFKMRDVSVNRTSPPKASSPCSQFKKAGGSNSDEANETNTRKRKLFTTRKDSTDIADGVAEGVKSKAAAAADDVSANDRKEGVLKKVKKEPGYSMDDPFYVANDSEEIEKKRKFAKTSIIKSETKGGEKNIAGKSIDNPIDLDDNIQTTTTTTTTSTRRGSNHNLDLEDRIKKLEKMLGVTLD